MAPNADDASRVSSAARPPLTAAERGFWRDVAEAIYPGWRIGIGDAETHAAARQLDLFVYAFDTGNLWLGAAALEGPLAKLAVAEGLASPMTREQVLDAAANAIADAADAGAIATDSRTHAAVKLTWHALGRTKTYAQVEAKNPTLRGHWVYVLYRLMDGGRIARPFFTQHAKPGLMDPARLAGLVRQVVAMDLDSHDSTVGAALAAGGGPRLAAPLRP